MTAREHNISMDELKFANAWSRGGMSNAKIPIKITGIKIEGAVFDGVKLGECSWDTSTYSTGMKKTRLHEYFLFIIIFISLDCIN